MWWWRLTPSPSASAGVCGKAVGRWLSPSVHPDPEHCRRVEGSSGGVRTVCAATGVLGRGLPFDAEEPSPSAVGEGQGEGPLPGRPRTADHCTGMIAALTHRSIPPRAVPAHPSTGSGRTGEGVAGAGRVRPIGNGQQPGTKLRNRAVVRQRVVPHPGPLPLRRERGEWRFDDGPQLTTSFLASY